MPQLLAPPPLAIQLPWQTTGPSLPNPLPSGNTSHPTSGLIGLRNLQPRSLVTGNTSCTYRLRYPVTRTATKIRMTFPAWSTVTAGVGDVPTGNLVTLAAVYAEYGGTLYPVTFNGASSYVIDSGGAVTSDIVSGLTVASGTNLFIRTYVTVPSGGSWPGLYGSFTFPDEVSRPNTNLANATGDLTGTGQSVADLYGPLRVFGEYALGQKFNSVTICGDSIAAGTNDSFSSEANVGYYQRALWAAGDRPFSIVALPGENGTQLLAQGPNRADIVGEYVDYVINEYGINDLQSGATLAQLQARSFANTVITRNPWVNGRYQQTLGPKSASTDGWVTTTNQTTDGINTARIQFNDWVRDGMPEIGQNAVATGTVGAIRAGQGGHPYTGYLEVADLCESARNSGIWKANYTSDGLHPNVTGNAAIAGAIDLSFLVDTFPTTAPAASLVHDASSPGISSSAFQGSAASQAYTSPSFSPPAGSVIVVGAQATESFNNAWNTPTITDSLGSHLTWTLVTQQADVTFGGADTSAALFWAYTASAPGAMTVTVTQSLGGSGQTVTFSSLAVDVWTGVDTTAPIGNTAKGILTANALPVSLTPAGSNSALLILANNAAAASGASSAGTGEYMFEETHVGTSFAQAWYGTAAGPTTPATAQTLDLNGATARWQYIAYELKASVPPTAITLFDAGTPVDALAVSIAVSLADTASAADGISASSSGTNITLTDTGTGTDAATIAAQVTQAETATGTDSLGVAVAVSLTDLASGSDALGANAAVSLADPRPVVDAVTAAAAVTQADTGTGADALSVAATVALADVGTGTDSISVGGSASPSLPETAAGTDALTVMVSTTLAEASTVTDAVSLAAAVALADTGSGSDATSVAGSSSPVLPETATGGDALAANATASLTDTATGTDALVIAQARTLTDSVVGADALSVTPALPLSETAAVADAFSVIVAAPLSDLVHAAESLSRSSPDDVIRDLVLTFALEPQRWTLAAQLARYTLDVQPARYTLRTEAP